MKRNAIKTALLFSLPFLLIGCGKEVVVGPKGEDGLTPYIGENGNWWIGEEDTGTPATGDTGDKGEDGDPGDDGLTPYIGDNGNWWIGEEDTGTPAAGEDGDKGKDGEPGKDGFNLLTGHGEPDSEKGKNGDSYIDLDSWSYFVKEKNEWVEEGNIKGNQGNQGVSIVNSEIDENGELIVELSNGETINAGHIKDVNEYTVNFYCGDLLIDTQHVKHGDKITSLPELEDFTVKHWYLDKEFEYEWLWYGCFVTEDMNLYGKYEGINKTATFNQSIEIDENGFGQITADSKTICVSKANTFSDDLVSLQDRGILFNKDEVGLISEIKVDIAGDGFESAKIYYGVTPLSFDYSQDLVSGVNTIELSNCEYFTIQNTSSGSISINSLRITYQRKAVINNEELPTVVINTKNSQAVTSRLEYVDCDVSTIGAEKDVSNLKAQIKVRGNSTSWLPKKPYRIKLSKKSSLFGYEKAKNWVLLADYMDGSNMHNYTALKFAKMVRGEDTFGVNPLHVNVVLNGENIGIYEFGEHIDAKEGRLNIEQDNIWEKSFDDINFYIERDLSTAQDSSEVEGVTYFRIDMEEYSPAQYVFALKYPEKEDFEEELESGEIDTHEEEFNSFFNSLKEYMADICNKFVEYTNDATKFSGLVSKVDVESLAEYAVIDQVFRESDHAQKSFKMYRAECGLLKFGPNWDYDSCAYGLPYKGTYVLNPFEVGISVFNSTWFGEKWGYTLFNDINNGRPLFKNVWDRLSNNEINSFIQQQSQEMKTISYSSVYDCGKWMDNQYYCLFDNMQYYHAYLSAQLPYLFNYYSSL